MSNFLIQEIDDTEDELREVKKEIADLQSQLNDLLQDKDRLETQLEDLKSQLQEPRNLHQKFHLNYCGE